MYQLVVIHHIILSNFNEGTRMTIPMSQNIAIDFLFVSFRAFENHTK